MERIPGRDAHFLYEESPGQPMHTLKLLLFDTPPGASGLTVEEVREALGPRIRELLPLRRRMVPVPLRIFHPIWFDAGDPDLDFHVRQARVGEGEERVVLGELVARLASERLDRAHPLWQLWVVGGLRSGRGALIVKLHHAIGDGHASARLIAHLLGPLSPTQTGTPTTGAEERPSDLRLFLDGARELAGTLLRGGVILRRATRAGRASTRLRQTSGAGLAGSFSSPKLPWSRRPAMRRSFGFVSLDRDELALLQQARGCTSAELILAIMGGALRSYTREHGIAERDGLNASVPVSLRGPDQLEEWGNHVGTVFIELATGLEDPLERLRLISGAMSAVREQREVLDLGHWDELWELYPLMRFSYLAALAVMHRAVGRPTFSLIVSSVPGPPAPLSCCGARLEGIYSLGVLTEDQGLNVTTWSYGDRIGFGITSCPEFLPDVWDLVGRVPQALEELRRCSDLNVQSGESVA